MVRCGYCSKEVSAGAGYQTFRYGFICYSCADVLNVKFCSVCSQRFPFSEMVEFNGEFFCKNDYSGRMAAIESYKPKPEPKGPPVTSGAGLRSARIRGPKTKVPYESLSNEIAAMSKPPRAVQPIKEDEQTVDKPESPAEEKEEVSKLLNDLQKEPETNDKDDKKEFSKVLKRLKKSEDKDND